MAEPDNKDTGIRILHDVPAAAPRPDAITAEPRGPRKERALPTPLLPEFFHERPFRWDRVFIAAQPGRFVRRLVVVSLFIVLAGPLVFMFGLSWLWVALVAGVALVTDLILEPHPDILHFQEILAARESILAKEMFERYFLASTMRCAVPAEVRRIYSDCTGFPTTLLLPDDHLGPLLSRRQRARLAHSLEKTFGLKLTGAELTAMTIRTVSMRVCTSGDASLLDRLTTRFGPPTEPAPAKEGPANP